MTGENDSTRSLAMRGGLPTLYALALNARFYDILMGELPAPVPPAGKRTSEETTVKQPPSLERVLLRQ